MIREVILVEVVTKSDMSTDKSKTFTNTEKAEKYFADCVREITPNIGQEKLDWALDDGYYDEPQFDTEPSLEGRSVIIKEISFEED